MARVISAGNRSEKMANALAAMEDVKGSNLRGQSKDAGEIRGTGKMFGLDNKETAVLRDATYVVYSYDTPILAFVPRNPIADNGETVDARGWVAFNRRYSVTTTNHQNIAKRATGARTLI